MEPHLAGHRTRKLTIQHTTDDIVNRIIDMHHECLEGRASIRKLQ